MIEKEKKIKEQRTLEATKKGLLGFSGKYGTILRFLGQPIIDCTEGGFGSIDGDFYGRIENQLFSTDSYNNEEIQTIEIFDEYGNPIESPNSTEWNSSKPLRKNYSTTKMGFYYQNTNNPKFNLEIKFIDDEKELIVRVNGETVFKEISGELVMYVPDEEFETYISRLYDKARKLENQFLKKENELKIIKAEKSKASWLETMKKLWGFS